MPFLQTEPGGDILQTESGLGIEVTQATSNDDIQLFDFSINLLQAILWQYNDATNIQGILAEKNAWYIANQQDFWSEWIQNVFNLATANQFGLSVWSVILGLPLYVNAPYDPDAPTWGYGGTNGDVNFDNGNFNDNGGYSFFLPLNTQRIALQLRYFQLVSSGTLPEINRALAYVFASYGSAYLLDNHDMTQTYFFNFPVTWDLAYLFKNYDVLPRPAGVSSSVIDATLVYFGFNTFNDNFDNGNYGA
jgi:Protein of unknown function (DUF2612)